jgi:glycosyltransferase involved in cell wall biosynthesis
MTNGTRPWPLVTVIATCFNHERFVVESLESIRAQIYPNIQLIIADDCSTDDSVPLIKEWLRTTGTACTLIIHDENQGVCRTRNETLSHARGKYVSSISTDDSWLPEKLAVQVEQMEKLPHSVGAVYGDASRMDEDGRPLPKTFIEQIGTLERMPEGDIYETLLERNFIPTGTLVRRECFEAVGPYDESLIYEDWDMWLRIARRYEFAFTPRIGARYRVHEGSLSHSLSIRSGGSLWWEADIGIFLKHLGYSPAWDTILWDRIARSAYRLHLPERLEYAHANLRAGRNLRALALYVLCRAGIPYRRLAPLKHAVTGLAGAAFRASDQKQLPPAGYSTDTSL